MIVAQPRSKHHLWPFLPKKLCPWEGIVRAFEGWAFFTHDESIIFGRISGPFLPLLFLKWRGTPAHRRDQHRVRFPAARTKRSWPLARRPPRFLKLLDLNLLLFLFLYVFVVVFPLDVSYQVLHFSHVVVVFAEVVCVLGGALLARFWRRKLELELSAISLFRRSQSLRHASMRSNWG